MSEIKLAVLTMGVILLFFGATGSGDMKEEELHLASYCKMVSVHIQSGGKGGWPDYKGNYAEACK